MSLIAAKNYNPATYVSVSGNSGGGLKAIDTTNLRLTFTVPDSGNVMVHMGACLYGYSSHPGIIFGVMNGTAPVVAVSAKGSRSGSTYSTNTTTTPIEAVFVVTGLTPGASLTWDAAYTCSVTSSSMNIYYGGSLTTGTAYGAFQFEVWAA